MELENEEVKTAAREAVWKADWAPGIWWTFIGENAKGAHLRVYFFPGALASLPC